MILMREVKIPSGVKVAIEGNALKVSGKLGSTAKQLNQKLFEVKVTGDTITVDSKKHKKLAKKADLAAQAFTSEVQSATESVMNGIEHKMQAVSAHFPMTFEVKGDTLFVKNIFGERAPRSTKLVGDTKLEVKGQEVKVKGVDKYDVGQTIANIRKVCKSKDKDTRVFQDGLYLVREE